MQVRFEANLNLYLVPLDLYASADGALVFSLKGEEEDVEVKRLRSAPDGEHEGE